MACVGVNVGVGLVVEAPEFGDCVVVGSLAFIANGCNLNGASGLCLDVSAPCSSGSILCNVLAKVAGIVLFPLAVGDGVGGESEDVGKVVAVISCASATNLVN